MSAPMSKTAKKAAKKREKELRDGVTPTTPATTTSATATIASPTATPTTVASASAASSSVSTAAPSTTSQVTTSTAPAASTAVPTPTVPALRTPTTTAPASSSTAIGSTPTAAIGSTPTAATATPTAATATPASAQPASAWGAKQTGAKLQQTSAAATQAQAARPAQAVSAQTASVPPSAAVQASPIANTPQQKPATKAAATATPAAATIAATTPAAAAATTPAATPATAAATPTAAITAPAAATPAAATTAAAAAAATPAATAPATAPAPAATPAAATPAAAAAATPAAAIPAAAAATPPAAATPTSTAAATPAKSPAPVTFHTGGWGAALAQVGARPPAAAPSTSAVNPVTGLSPVSGNSSGPYRPPQARGGGGGSRGGGGSFRGGGGGGRGGGAFGVHTAVSAGEKICMLHNAGRCTFASPGATSCPRGRHLERDTKLLQVPTENTVFSPVTNAKFRLIQQKWTDAGGIGKLDSVWQVHNSRSNFVFRATEHNMMETHGHASDIIDAWHGTHEDNVFSIAINGFDTSRRSGQVYGAGEYFAKNPTVSVSYSKGGSYMFLCKLLLGKPDVDHTWVDTCGYYVIKQAEGQVQGLPLYLVRFGLDALHHGYGYMSSMGSTGKKGVGGTIMNINDSSDVWGVAVAEEEFCYRLDSGRVAKYESEGVRWKWAPASAAATLPVTALSRKLASVVQEAESKVSSSLAAAQRGGQSACIARRDAGMVAYCTKHLWVGWLDPSLAAKDNDAVEADVKAFLAPHYVVEVRPERNGARVGAYAKLADNINQQAFRKIAEKKYHGVHSISVDDAQPNNPMTSGKLCPRLNGPSKYCRGWNIRGHKAWHWGCSFSHPEHIRPTHKATYTLEDVSAAMRDQIMTDIARDYGFHDGTPKVTNVKKVVNSTLTQLYNMRHSFLTEKHGFVVEKDLWHGTACYALPDILTNGLQPPSDTKPGDKCTRSGGKNLSTTLCSTECKECVEPHEWRSCHMFGLGVYLADSARKSHRYVKPIGKKYSMLYCRTLLGNPYLIEGNLLKGDAMHDECWCADPADWLDSIADEWDVAKGHDSYYVKGQAGKQRHGLGVENSEYIVFQPAQVLPLYLVDYELAP